MGSVPAHRRLEAHKDALVSFCVVHMTDAMIEACFFSKTLYERGSFSTDCEAAMAREHYLDIAPLSRTAIARSGVL
jgi:hypothetical protein